MCWFYFPNTSKQSATGPICPVLNRPRNRNCPDLAENSTKRPTLLQASKKTKPKKPLNHVSQLPITSNQQLFYHLILSQNYTQLSSMDNLPLTYLSAFSLGAITLSLLCHVCICSRCSHSKMSEAVAIHKMSGYTALILNLSLLMKRSICKPKAIYTEMRGFFCTQTWKKQNYSYYTKCFLGTSIC